jgi:hypothetical protein
MVEHYATDSLFDLPKFAIKICTLIRSTHSGKTSEAQVKKPMLKSRNNANARPRNAIQRGIIPVRSESVQVEIMNTPAIFIV